MRQAAEILEFDKLKGILAQQIRTPLGAAIVERLAPMIELQEIASELQRTSEGVTYLSKGAALDIHDLSDPHPALGKLAIADVNLEPQDILCLLRLISVAVDLRETFHAEADRFPLLNEITGNVANLRPLYQRLRRSILPSGEVDDSASPELREARVNISRLRGQIQRSLESILKRAEETHALQEDFITIRNERYVIPIRNDNRGAVSGVVHGMSSSGQTAFIEPLETIELNNDLVRLCEIEQTEVTKVLFRITEELRIEHDALTQMAEVIAKIDFIVAKASLAIAQQAIEPRINSEGRFLLKEARHPLLEAHLKAQRLDIVPISIELNADQRVMVVSGPNAGGKTIVLKTIGLLALMAQSGLHVPATEADLPIFHQVQPDIGDHQSIAANLSTFTAHIENIRRISSELEIPALVLLDEVGTGTDPEEGAALGVAIVDYFRQHGAHVVVTTHYGPLKIYATTTPGVLNASVEFDERTLKPTYRLVTGLAGASSGIEIARRFGLPEIITNSATARVTSSSTEATNYLRRLKEQYDAQQQMLVALEEERAAVAAKYAELESKFAHRERARKDEFRVELQKVVDEFVARAEKFVATIKDSAEARRTRKEIEKRAAEMRSAAAHEFHQHSIPAAAIEQAPLKARTPLEGFQVGDRVRVLALEQEGVVESVGEDAIEVQVGALRFREQPQNLQLIERLATNKAKRSATALPQGISVTLHERPTSSELNVIGQTVNEAAEATDKFLDEAYLNNYDRVRIVHGIGMGALKRAVTALLTNHPHVAKFYPATPSEGGGGATIVELKK